MHDVSIVAHAATIVLVVFAALALIDGVYLHLIRFKPVRQLYPGAIVLAILHIRLAVRYRPKPVRRAT